MTAVLSKSRSRDTSKWSVVKRDGSVEPFDIDKIKKALARCFKNGMGLDQSSDLVGHITIRVINYLASQKLSSTTVEDIQRAVITQLWSDGLEEAATHYTLYREERRKKREERPIPQELIKLIEEDAKHFPTPLQYYQFISKFARWKEEEKRRETWGEANARVFDWFSTIPQYKLLSKKEVEWLKSMMYTLKASPALRVVQMAGPALERCHVGCYNCAYLPISDLFSFAEVLYILMQGTGVGFSVESEYVNQLPRVQKQKKDYIGKYIVHDTTEGWCDALLHGLTKWFGGEDVEFLTHNIRKAGSRLKTKGGRASGPGPLLDLLLFAKNIILNAQGRQLKDLEVHDICCMTGKIVQVGGVRRASCISLSDIDSIPMRECKHGNWYLLNGQRSMANNSAVYDEPPSVEVFMEEWLHLTKSRSGERGICNRGGIIAGRPPRRGEAVFGFNPCQPAFATVLTPKGIRTLGEVEIGDTIWSGKGWTKITNKAMTGVKEVFRYRTTSGRFVGTKNHRVVEAGVKIPVGKAQAIDSCEGPIPPVNDYFPIDKQAVVDGWVLGDGTVHKASNNLIRLILGKKDGDFHKYYANYLIKKRPGLGAGSWEITTNIKHYELPRTYKRRVPDRYKNGKPYEVCSFLAGLYSANGSICGGRVTLKAASFGLILDVQEMLSSVGIRSYYTTNKPQRYPGTKYICRKSYDLNVGKDVKVFMNKIGFYLDYKVEKGMKIAETQKRNNRGKVTYDIVGIKSLGNHKVYDITVDCPEHTYWTGGVLVSNCAEIVLRPYEFCNLSIAIFRGNETREELIDKVKAATYFGVLQSCATNFNYIRQEWAKNCEEERLLGVDIMGHLDHPLLRPNAPHREELVSTLKEVVSEAAKSLSTRFGINYSAANTCLKPGGDSGVLFNTVSLSPYFSQYQIRRTRESVHSPVTSLLRDAGVPWEPAIEDEKGLVAFSWPKANPEGCITRDHLTAIEQLNNWLFWQTYWAEHSCSTTIYVKDDEWPEVGAWVWKHFDKITGIAFLPWDNGTYRTVPNEAISKETYDKLISEFPKIEWSKLLRYEDEDLTTSAVTYACVGDKCEL